MCSEQVGDAIGELARSPALCASYFEQWEQQRVRPFSVGLDDGFDGELILDRTALPQKRGVGVPLDFSFSSEQGAWPACDRLAICQHTSDKCAGFVGSVL